ncbi:cation transporter [Oculatella sp. LEGE 06141]|uniref:cation diffusion facilitator family transporter n=1 Tax=Oculatella sp. LEGE 06141 TaxID=1828648 RepID=UPI00187ECBDA|nr:cation diffusion facilitator family transporter [Oculatella sp. LEGE 06141]MBE9178137.1 cation transporter [Oculatella sp. LEGE 06141]
MTHHHSHHNHSSSHYNRAFAIGIVLNIGFVIVETVYGFLAHSIALLADAGHNSSDVLSLVLAWGASLLSQQKPTHRYTYGLRGSSILVSLTNAILLLLAMGAIGLESVQRFGYPEPIAGRTVITVAVVGILVNTITALLFMSGRQHDLNIRGAFLHMAADAGVSAGVVLAGIAIVLTGWQWVDPVVSLVVVVVVVIGTWQLLKDSLNLALNAVPEGIEPLAVRTFLEERPGVTQVHDLHIWAMSTTETALTVHLVMPEGHPGDDFLQQLCDQLHRHFGVDHSTIQIEVGDSLHICALAPDHIV